MLTKEHLKRIEQELDALDRQLKGTSVLDAPEIHAVREKLSNAYWNSQNKTLREQLQALATAGAALRKSYELSKNQLAPWQGALSTLVQVTGLAAKAAGLAANPLAWLA